MGKKILMLIFSLFFIIINFSGCQEQQIQSIQFEGITLDSDVVELVNASIKYTRDDFEKVYLVDVHFLFHNIAGRRIDRLKITVEFYDENDNLIAIGGPKYTHYLPSDYTEQFDPNFNVISYEGEKADQIDHVKIIALEEKAR